MQIRYRNATFVAASILGATLLAVPAEARHVSIDDNLVPSFLFSFDPATPCSGALCLSSTLPYRVDLGGGQSSDQVFVNSDGVITFGTEAHDYDSVNALHSGGVNFAAPVVATDYDPGFARFHVTTEQDVIDSATYKVGVCQSFFGPTDFHCKPGDSTDDDVPFYTVDEFIAANNWNRYLGDVVIQSGAGFVVLSRGPGSPTGIGTLYTLDDFTLEDGFGVTDYYSDFAFAGQRSENGFDQFSFNINSGVPEPSTWLMLIMGFGLAGAALRTSRGKVRLSYS